MVKGCRGEGQVKDPCPAVLAYYSTHGPVTDPGPHADLLRQVPGDARGTARTVQGLLLHVYLGDLYGVQVPDERRHEPGLRWLGSMLSRAMELDGSPLDQPRPPRSRLLGTCRDFAVLMTAVLRQAGTPARARCGFATYLSPGRFEDHWVTEYWDRARHRWILADSQLDPVQVDRFGVDFDPCDIPPGRFLPGGRAWLMCREEGVDPLLFGIHDLKGSWFVQGNVIRDVLALARTEILPWDVWGPMAQPGRPAGGEEAALADALAPLSMEPDVHHRQILAVTGEPGSLDPPGWWPGDGEPSVTG